MIEVKWNSDYQGSLSTADPYRPQLNFMKPAWGTVDVGFTTEWQVIKIVTNHN